MIFHSYDLICKRNEPFYGFGCMNEGDGCIGFEKKVKNFYFFTFTKYFLCISNLSENKKLTFYA